MKQEKIDEMILKCYRELFKEAEPSADIDKILKSGEGKFPNFFLAYYLLDTRAIEIIDKIAREYKLDEVMKRKLRTEILLGACPCGVKSVVEKERKDYEKRLKKFLSQKSEQR